jgi:hypothetical protein
MRYRISLGKVRRQGGGWREGSISGCELARDQTPRPGLKESLVAAKGLHWESWAPIITDRRNCDV